MSSHSWVFFLFFFVVLQGALTCWREPLPLGSPSEDPHECQDPRFSTGALHNSEMDQCLFLSVVSGFNVVADQRTLYRRSCPPFWVHFIMIITFRWWLYLWHVWSISADKRDGWIMAAHSSACDCSHTFPWNELWWTDKQPAHFQNVQGQTCIAYWECQLGSISYHLAYTSQWSGCWSPWTRELSFRALMK